MKPLLKFIVFILELTAVFAAPFCGIAGVLASSAAMKSLYENGLPTVKAALTLVVYYPTIIIPMAIAYFIFKNHQNGGEKDVRALKLNILEMVLPLLSLLAAGAVFIAFASEKSLILAIALSVVSVAALALAFKVEALFIPTSNGFMKTTEIETANDLSFPPITTEQAAQPLERPQPQRSAMKKGDRRAVIAFGLFLSFIFIGGTISSNDPISSKIFMLGFILFFWALCLNFGKVTSWIQRHNVTKEPVYSAHPQGFVAPHNGQPADKKATQKKELIIILGIGVCLFLILAFALFMSSTFDNARLARIQFFLVIAAPLWGILIGLIIRLVRWKKRQGDRT